MKFPGLNSKNALRAMGALVVALTFSPTLSSEAATCAGSGNGVVLIREVADDSYAPGGTLDVQVTICYSGPSSVTQLGLTEVIPAGWGFAGVSGPNAPQILPQLNDTESLDFAYLSIPELPATFTYSLNVPADAAGDQSISGHVLYAFVTGRQQSPEAVSVLSEGAPAEGGQEGEDDVVRCESAGDSVVLTREVAGNIYEPSKEVLVKVTLCYGGSETATSLGIEETLPEGWTFQGIVSGNPQIFPENGDSGTLPFAYIFIPSFPVSFTYRALAPADATGQQTIEGDGMYSFSGSQERTNFVATELAQGVLPDEEEGEEIDYSVHTADFDSDGQVSLSELLRIVQFYNSGHVSCGLNTEDGYSPLAGLTDCLPHATDYAPQDWAISLSELLRVVQFYNASGYHYCPNGSEDNYCPEM